MGLLDFLNGPTGLFVQKGLNLFGQANLNYKADKAEAKANQKWQAYRNTMTNLSGAMQQNSITINERLSEFAFASQAISDKRANLLTVGASEAAAAAAGVKGNSVNRVMFDINRNAAIKDRQRQINLQNARLAFDESRRASAMSTKMQMDFSYIPKPKAASYYLDAFQDTQDVYSDLFGGGSGGSGNKESTYYPNSNTWITWN